MGSGRLSVPESESLFAGDESDGECGLAAGRAGGEEEEEVRSGKWEVGSGEGVNGGGVFGGGEARVRSLAGAGFCGEGG
jgi:hypothetical protein